MKEIDEIIAQLVEFKGDFDLNFSKSENGRNQGKRDAADRELNSILSTTANYIINNNVFDLIRAGDNHTDRAYFEDDFYQKYLFSSAMSDLIQDLRQL